MCFSEVFFHEKEYFFGLQLPPRCPLHKLPAQWKARLQPVYFSVLNGISFAFSKLLLPQSFSLFRASPHELLQSRGSPGRTIEPAHSRQFAHTNKFRTGW